MSGFSDFLTTVKDWVNRPDLSDALVTSWVRMAESRMNRELRCREMISRSRATTSDSYLPLPTDWLEFTHLRFVPDADSDSADVKYGRPLHFVSSDQMWEVLHDTNHELKNRPLYAIVGNEVIINPLLSEATEVEIGYYHTVEAFTGDSPALNTAYPDLYLYATLSASPGYFVEDDRLTLWASQATAAIQTINERWISAKTSGSPMRMKHRSFG